MGETADADPSRDTSEAPELSHELLDGPTANSQEGGILKLKLLFVTN
jgi:hypothetical protein